MDHQHFEEYLLNGTPIPREEKVAFEAHLKVCARCAALVEVNRSLNHVVMAAPAPGFTDRFQARLVAQRKAERRRHFFGLFILLLAALGMGIWFALPILPTVIFSPSTLLSAWAQTLASIISLLQALVEAGNVILHVAARFVPGEAWAFSLTFFSLLTVAWAFSYQKIMRLPQAI